MAKALVLYHSQEFGNTGAMAEAVADGLKEAGCEAEEGDFLDKVVETLNTRSKTLKEMAEGALFYFPDIVSYDEDAAKKFLNASILEPFKLLIDELKSLDDFTEKALETPFKTVMEKTDLKFGKIAQPLRVALTGKTVSPGIFEVLEVLGKEKVIKRLEKAVQYIENL